MLTEGTYPQAFGGVSVWCDQLVRACRTPRSTCTRSRSPARSRPPGTRRQRLPSTPSRCGRAARRGRPRRRAGLAGDRSPRRTGICCGAARCRPRRPPRPSAAALRELAEFAATRSGRGACAPVRPRRRPAGCWTRGRRAPRDGRPPAPTVHDALTAADIIEHSLRPLLHPAPQADVTHAVTNGLATLLALAASGRYGTPCCSPSTASTCGSATSGCAARPVQLAGQGDAARLPCGCSAPRLPRADLITPGNKYNRRWESAVRRRPDNDRDGLQRRGARTTSRPPAREPEVPTVTWAGRIDPIKDLETLIRASPWSARSCRTPGCGSSAAPRPAARLPRHAARRWPPSSA